MLLNINNVSKVFKLHLHNGKHRTAFRSVSFQVHPGECVCIHGSSGSGKTSLLNCIYGTYKPTTGTIAISYEGTMLDLSTVSDRAMLAIRRSTIGFVSQFLRVIPRLTVIDIVKEPLIECGVDAASALAKAALLLDKLGLKPEIYDVSPAQLSGGERQRINLARGLIVSRPLLLLDEPTASLDSRNADLVLALFKQIKNSGAGIVAVFHDKRFVSELADVFVNL